MKRYYMLSILLVFLPFFYGCASDDGSDYSNGGDSDFDEDVALCWNDIAVGQKVEFLSGLDDGTEGIAFDGKGHVFISNGDRVIRVDSDGNFEKFADVPKSVGLAVDKDGNVIVAAFGAKFDQTTIDGAIYGFKDDGSSLFLIENQIANPNFITRTPWGSWLISDDIGSNIWELSDGGNLSIWSNMVNSPNGMVFSPSGDALFVCSTFDDSAPVYSLSIKEHLATNSTKIVELLQKGLNDGIAMDDEGNLYVAANGKGSVVRISPNGEFEVIADGLFSPASIAFGLGEGFDPCSIYVTELLGDTVWRINVGKRGAKLFY